MTRTKKIGAALAALGLMLIILWSSGFFSSGTIEPGVEETPLRPVQGVELAEVSLQPVMDWYEAVGTVIPLTETSIEAQVQAKVLEVLVRPGDSVAKDQPLVILDDRELASRLEQAQQGTLSAQAARDQAAQNVNAARAAYSRAESNYQRMKTLFSENTITLSELEVAEAEYLTAQAGLQQARDGLQAAEAAHSRSEKVIEEATIASSYSRILAPADGEINARMVEPGDLAVPGKPLLSIQTGATMQLSALVREGLISEVRPGRELDVVITALEACVRGVVEELVPSADPRTRTFEVKLGLPALPGLYPGMFGRVLVPMEEREVVIVPLAAINRVGQMETVDVVITGKDGQESLSTVFVRTGRVLGNDMEILSGLEPGDRVAVPTRNGAQDQAEESDG